MKKKEIFLIIGFIIIIIFIWNFLLKKEIYVAVNSSNVISNKKISWGIKRGDNNLQPDIGRENKKLLDEYKGISLRK